jgi:D-amino peptidase
MKIMIQADLEGATGVTSFGQVIPGSSAYERSCRSLTEDVNAAIRGIYEGAQRHSAVPIVDIVDGHFHMHNIDLERLDPRINSYTAGYERALLQLQGLDETYNAIFCIGQHDGTGGKGVMAHTWVRWRWVVNGVDCTETQLNAFTAGDLGVPLAMVTGDDVLIDKTQQACEAAGTPVEAVITKQALGFATARCFHPSRIRDEIARAAERAVSGILAERFSPIRCGRPVRIDLTVNDKEQVQRICDASLGIRHAGETMVSWEAETFLEAIVVGSGALHVLFEEILTRACQNLVPWYRTPVVVPS